MSLASPKQKSPNIEIFNHQNDLLIDHCYIKSVMQKLCMFRGVQTDRIVVHFVNEERICQIHKQLFDDDSFTDCVTCPIDPYQEDIPYHVLGECFICPLAACQSAPDEPQSELLLYLVHCFLHLTGYEDQTDHGKATMRKEEQLLMDQLTTKKSRLL